VFKRKKRRCYQVKNNRQKYKKVPVKKRKKVLRVPETPVSASKILYESSILYKKVFKKLRK
jgi:hypothetical protein